MSMPTNPKRLAGALIAGGLLAGGAAGPAQAEDIRWKMPISFPSDLPALAKPSHYLADRLKTASGGSIELRIYEPGELVPGLGVLEAVADGKVNAGYTGLLYDVGKVPATALFGGSPFSMPPWAFFAWYHYGGGHEMLQEVYDNKGFDVHAQLCGIIGPETAGWYHKRITKLSDYKGLKIRFAGLGGEVVQRLGASVTLMSGGQIYQALQTGTLDATEFSLPVIDQNLGFPEIVKYNLFPGWHQPYSGVYFLVNEQAWSRTTEQQKALIETTCTAATTMGLAEGEYKNGKVLADFKDQGVVTDQIPEDVLKELRATAEQVLQEQADQDEDFARVWESQQEFMHYYKIWNKRAYMDADMYISKTPKSEQ